MNEYAPLLWIFCSGIGFAIQALFQKLLSEGGFHDTMTSVFVRGVVQTLVFSVLWLFDEERKHADSFCKSLFGPSTFTAVLLIGRGVVGFFSIAFAFLAFDTLPLGDATVLIMLGPVVAAILGSLFLEEPWLLPEMIATVMTLAGACFVAKPPFLFDYSSFDDSISNSTATNSTFDSFNASSLSSFQYPVGDQMGGISADVMSSYSSIDQYNGTLHPHTESAITVSLEPLQPFNMLGVVFGLSASLCGGTVYTMIRALGTRARVSYKNVCLFQGIGQVLLALPAVYMSGQHMAFMQYTRTQLIYLLVSASVATFSQILMTLGIATAVYVCNVNNYTYVYDC